MNKSFHQNTDKTLDFSLSLISIKYKFYNWELGNYSKILIFNKPHYRCEMEACGGRDPSFKY